MISFGFKKTKICS